MYPIPYPFTILFSVVSSTLAPITYEELGVPGASLVAQTVKNPPAMWETWVQSLSQEDPLEEGMVTQLSILAWRIPMDRGSQTVRHN